MAKAANEVFEDTADGIVVLSSRSTAAAKEMELSKKHYRILYAKRPRRIQNGKRQEMLL
jgi:hypothetical protein